MRQILTFLTILVLCSCKQQNEQTKISRNPTPLDSANNSAVLETDEKVNNKATVKDSTDWEKHQDSLRNKILKGKKGKNKKEYTLDSKKGKIAFELVEVKQISNKKREDSIVSRLKSLKVEFDEKNIFVNNFSAKYSSAKSDSKHFFGKNYVYSYYSNYLKNYKIDIKKDVNYIEISYEDAQKFPFKDFFIEGGVAVFKNDYLFLQYLDYIITFKKSLDYPSEKKLLLTLPFDYQKYLDECYLEENAKCDERYPRIEGNELKSITNLINEKINKNKPDVVYHINNGGLPFETYIFQIQDEKADYFLNQVIMNVKNQNLISKKVIGVEGNGDIPEDVDYIAKSFVLSKDLTIRFYSKIYKKTEERYKITPDGKIVRLK